MNPEWFGDSYDIVKRYFVALLKDAGFSVFLDPMFTGGGEKIEKDFHAFIGAPSRNGEMVSGMRTALLLDPDTGVGKKKTAQHVTIDDIVRDLQYYSIVFCFDQSFSRNRAGDEQMQEKLKALSQRGVHGFYYDSHARFLFTAVKKHDLITVFSVLCASGLPQSRLVFQ